MLTITPSKIFQWIKKKELTKKKVASDKKIIALKIFFFFNFFLLIALVFMDSNQFFYINEADGEVDEYVEYLISKFQTMMKMDKTNNKPQYYKLLFELLEESCNTTVYQPIYINVLYIIIHEYMQDAIFRVNNVEKVKKIVKQYEDKNINIFEVIGLPDETFKLRFYFGLARWYMIENNLLNGFRIVNNILNRYESFTVKDKHLLELIGEKLGDILTGLERLEVEKFEILTKNKDVKKAFLKKKSIGVKIILKYFKNVDKTIRPVRWHGWVGRCYFSLGNHSMSILCWENALVTIEKTQNLDPEKRRQWRYGTYTMLTQVYIKMNDVVNAKHCLRNAKGLGNKSDKQPDYDFLKTLEEKIKNIKEIPSDKPNMKQNTTKIKTKLKRICGNVNCEKIESKRGDFKTCRVCGVECYCSVKCYEIHYPTHKKHCKWFKKK